MNPHWKANYTNLPTHAVTRGVAPFKINDEWYYHMRFPEGMKHVTPILTAVPPDSTRGKPGANDEHGGNPEVQQHMGEPEHMMWVIERPDGGRGFGFTGGHTHKNWGDENFRKVVLNAILWTAKMEVPAQGIKSQITDEDLAGESGSQGQTITGAEAKELSVFCFPTFGRMTGESLVIQIALERAFIRSCPRS